MTLTRRKLFITGLAFRECTATTSHLNGKATIASSLTARAASCTSPIPSRTGWFPGRNPFGLYLYTEDVDALAAAFANDLAGKKGPEDKPWGTYEFALSDPDQTLVRVGRRLQR
jgi:hypothetical protein